MTNVIETWNEVFHGNDVVFSEKPETQNQLFDLTKINFLKEIFGSKKKKMLEVGAGSAYFSLYFAKRNFDSTCLDINSKILKIGKDNFAKEKTKRKFVVGNDEKLPFKKNSF